MDNNDILSEFRNSISGFYEKLTGYLIESGLENIAVHRYSNIFLNRISMLCFIQEKGWLDGNTRFLQWYLQQYQQSGDSESFHSKWLNTLLFKTFNTPPCARVLHPDLPDEVCSALRRIPYLNDALFQKEDLDNKNVQIPDNILISLIEGLLQFEYKVDELQFDDKFGYLDPSVLSRIYRLMRVQMQQDIEGVVYTPKSGVDLICRMALFDYILEGTVLGLNPFEKDQLDKLRTSENHPALFDLIFTLLETWNPKEIQGQNILKKLLQTVRIIDPACGSGALLVGMLSLLIEILEKLGVKPDYHTRANLVRNCIHGTDLDDWAIKLTEFRLWLVIAQGDLLPLRQPVLPNLVLNLTVGDSLVQQVNKQCFSLNGFRGNLSENLIEHLDNLEQLMEQYYFGDSLLYDDIRQEQQSLVETYLKEIQNQDTTELLEQLRYLEERQFLWDLSFPHIMLRGGFDIAIANPPYVRSEQISSDKEYKLMLHDYVKMYHGKAVSGRSDLYLFFFFKTLEILQSGGCFVFITSNSWLDVDFGHALQEKILDSTELRFLLECSSSRTFRDSSINTVITAGRKSSRPVSGKTLFLTLKEPLHAASSELIKKALLGCDDIETVVFSGVPIEISESNQMKRVSVKTEALSHIGAGKWGRLLRAPAIFFKISERKGNILTPLGELAEVRRGLTTGANDFFYLPKPGCKSKYFQSEFEPSTGCLLLYVLPEVTDTLQRQGFAIKSPMFRIESQYWMHKVDDDTELLCIYDVVHKARGSFWVPNYVVKGPKDLETIIVNPRKSKHVVVLAHEPKEKLEQGIQEYIQWGEIYEPETGNKYPNRSTCRSRQLWYDLGSPTPPDLLWIKGIWERHLVALVNRTCYIDQQLYGISLDNQSLLFTTLGILNSTLTTLFAELTGRVNLGEGVLWTAAYEAESIPVLKEPNSKIIGLVEKILSKPVQSIFDYLGSRNPTAITLSQIDPNRRALDSLIMGEIMGLNEQEQLQLYRDVVTLVTSRLKKAKSNVTGNE
jgi:hypothetical protein